jgi:hypothetical protein
MALPFLLESQRIVGSLFWLEVATSAMSGENLEPKKALVTKTNLP